MRGVQTKEGRGGGVQCSNPASSSTSPWSSREVYPYTHRISSARVLVRLRLGNVTLGLRSWRERKTKRRRKRRKRMSSRYGENMSAVKRDRTRVCDRSPGKTSLTEIHSEPSSSTRRRCYIATLALNEAKGSWYQADTASHSALVLGYFPVWVRSSDI